MTDAAQSPHLSWWQRPRKLRRQLTGTLVLVAFVSVAIVGGLNFVGASRLLDEGAEESLSGIGEAQARTIETGAVRLLASVSTIAADLAVVEALDELRTTFDALERQSLEPDEQAELESFYASEVLAPLEEVGLGPVTLGDLLPASEAGRYLQYHYTLAEGEGALAARRDVDDAGDGSSYSRAHRDHHPFLARVASTLGATDLLLVAADGTVVYSVEKRIDVGTRLDSGPYRDTELAATVLDDLARVRVGVAVLADYERYIPGGGAPRLFAVAAIRSDTEVIGSIALQVPVEALNEITAADGRWEEVGLEGGESYVVGRDLLLRSESRRWLEDPDGYLNEIDDDLTRLVEKFGSPVGFQEIDTKAVREALDGDTFEGRTRNYLGSATYTYATPIDIPGVEWIVVADIPLSDARSPLFRFAALFGLIALVTLPAAALGGIVLSRRLTRSIPPVVATATAIAQGERDPQLPPLGNDEFGDLARRMLATSDELRRREKALLEEAEQTREMLLTVMPPRLVDEHGGVVPTDAAVHPATVVAVWVTVDTPDPPGEAAIVELLDEASLLVDRLAHARGMERVGRAADHHLLVSSPGADDATGADTALTFAEDLRRELATLAEAEEIPVAPKVGMATGPVATGLLERGQLTFAAWGAPVRRALAIAATDDGHPVVVDDATATAARSCGWSFEDGGELDVLEDVPLPLFLPDGRSP